MSEQPLADLRVSVEVGPEGVHRTVIEDIRWHAVADGLPDSDMSVLVYAPNMDEPVWIGFYDGEQWVSDGLVPYPSGSVHAWADLPAGGVP